MTPSQVTESLRELAEAESLALGELRESANRIEKDFYDHRLRVLRQCDHSDGLNSVGQCSVCGGPYEPIEWQ